MHEICPIFAPISPEFLPKFLHWQNGEGAMCPLCPNMFCISQINLYQISAELIAAVSVLQMIAVVKVR